jgi:hypothetical protein
MGWLVEAVVLAWLIMELRDTGGGLWLAPTSTSEWVVAVGEGLRLAVDWAGEGVLSLLCLIVGCFASLRLNATPSLGWTTGVAGSVSDPLGVWGLGERSGDAGFAGEWGMWLLRNRLRSWRGLWSLGVAGGAAGDWVGAGDVAGDGTELFLREVLKRNLERDVGDRLWGWPTSGSGRFGICSD